MRYVSTYLSSTRVTEMMVHPTQPCAMKRECVVRSTMCICTVHVYNRRIEKISTLKKIPTWLTQGIIIKF